MTAFLLFLALSSILVSMADDLYKVSGGKLKLKGAGGEKK